KGGNRIAAVGVIGRDRRHPLHLTPFRHQRGGGVALDCRVRGKAEDVGVKVLRGGQPRRFRDRGDEHDLVLLGDRRDRRRLGRGQRTGQKIDVVFDDQLARQAHRLGGGGLAVARQQLELASV